MLIETITMVKGEDEIVVNASERDTYVAAGYANKKAAAAEPAKDAEQQTATANATAAATAATTGAAKDASK